MVTGNTAHLMVATPCYGGQVAAAYLKSMLRLQSACRDQGVAFNYQECSGIPLVTYARNELVARFIETPEATHLLFIDADVAFEPEQAFRLLRFGADVAAAAYPRKTIDWRRVERAVKDGRPPETAALHYAVAWAETGPITVKNGFARVRYVGAGFLLLTRAAVTRLCEAHPELKYKRGQGEAYPNNPYCYGIFETMLLPEVEGYLSEDAAFCKRWADLGGEIWLDTQSKLVHIGPMAFHGDLVTQFERRDAPQP
jgi:hypothetical protein